VPLSNHITPLPLFRAGPYTFASRNQQASDGPSKMREGFPNLETLLGKEPVIIEEGEIEEETTAGYESSLSMDISDDESEMSADGMEIKTSDESVPRIAT
jgi:hypothetical protein